MEILITFLGRQSDGVLREYAASAAEFGWDAGRTTWQFAMEDADRLLGKQLKTPEQLQEARDYLRSGGGWTGEEIAEWTDTKLRAVILQFIAGELRRYKKARKEGKKALREYQENHGGMIYQHNRRYYAYIGN